MQRKRFSSEFKAKVALDAIRGEKTIAELAAEYGVHPTQIRNWKARVLQELPALFAGRTDQQGAGHEAEKSRLYEQIGKLQMELEWLKKKLP
jgi:transposase-like protein